MMTCDRFHDRLDAYLAGGVAEPERAEIEQHLEDCGECASVVASVLADGEPSIAFPVLARTTGRSCGRVQDAIAEGGPWSATMTAHVDECEPCARFVAVLTRCDRVLPQLAAVEADADFASDVIMATLSRPKLSRVAWRRWLDRLERWLERPRAAQEFAYAITVIAVLLTATPMSPFPQVSTWLSASPLTTSRDRASIAGDEALADRVIGEIQIRGTRLVRDLDRLGQGIATTGAGFLTGDPERVHRGADEVGCGLQSLWSGVRTPEVEVEGPCADPSAVQTGGGTKTACIVIATGERT